MKNIHFRTVPIWLLHILLSRFLSILYGGYWHRITVIKIFICDSFSMNPNMLSRHSFLFSNSPNNKYFFCNLFIVQKYFLKKNLCLKKVQKKLKALSITKKIEISKTLNQPIFTIFSSGFKSHQCRLLLLVSQRRL